MPAFLGIRPSKNSPLFRDETSQRSAWKPSIRLIWVRLEQWLGQIDVVYFNQQMGAPHAIPWSKSFIFALKADKMILTTQQLEKHPFAGQNTQQIELKWADKYLIYIRNNIYAKSRLKLVGKISSSPSLGTFHLFHPKADNKMDQLNCRMYFYDQNFESVNA